MNEIKIYLNPSGSTAELYKDFNLYQGSYRNVQISIYVPTAILYKNADNTFLNTVQTGAIITAPNGAKVTTISYNANFVKTVMRGNVEYAEFTQIMPKEYALYAGTQIIVCNVVNIDNTDPGAPKIIDITTTQRAPIIVLESAYLSNDAPVEPSELDILEGKVNDLYTFKDDMEQAVESAQNSATSSAESATTATEKAEVAGQNASNAEQSASNAENAAQRAESAANTLESVLNGETAVPKAIGDENGENIAEHFENIEVLIPSAASADNQLADKAYVNSSVNAMAAFYITSNADGDAFPTRAVLLSATTFYSGGQARVPTQNDYAIVLADESQPVGVDGKYPTTRYSYQGGTYPNGQWDFQYVVNNTSLTQAQVNAINSGITAQKIVEMEAATAAKYTKPMSGIPEADLSEAVQTKLNENGANPSNAAPLMDGTASAGTSVEYARGDHIHPSDTGKVNKSGDTMTGQLTIERNVSDLATFNSKSDYANIALTTKDGSKWLFEKHNNDLYLVLRDANNTNKCILYIPTFTGNGTIALTSNTWSNNNRPTAIQYVAGASTSEANQTDTVVSYYKSSDGSSWYRKWASGWKECGGITSTSVDNTAIALPITFANVDYVFVANTINSDSITPVTIKVKSKATNQCTIRSVYASPNGNGAASEAFNWYACGY